VTGTASSGLSPNGAAVAGTSRFAFVSYVVAALVGVLLLTQAAAGSWLLAALAVGSLPVCLAGGVFVVFGLGAAGSLAASAGLLAVFALAVRQVIAVTAREAPRLRGVNGSGDGPVDAAGAGGDLAIFLTPALVTAVAVAPFAAMGAVPGLELLHTAAAVILGGLASTALVTLFGLPVACRLLGPHLALDSATAVSAADAAHAPDGEHAAYADSAERAGIREDR